MNNLDNRKSLHRVIEAYVQAAVDDAVAARPGEKRTVAAGAALKAEMDRIFGPVEQQS